MSLNTGVQNFESPNDLLAGIGQEDSLKLYTMEFGVARPGLTICRPAGPLYYANAESFMVEVLSWFSSTVSTVQWFVLHFDSIKSVDYVAASMLMELADRMRNRGVTVVFAELSTGVRNFLSDSGVLPAIGLDTVFASVDAALAAYKLSEQEQQHMPD